MLKIHSIETFGTHDGPGIRLILFLQGCPFRCVYCHNPDSQPVNSPSQILMSEDDVVQLLDKQKSFFKNGGGLTVSGGEPTLQADALLKLFERVKKAGFHITLDTCGAIYNDKVNQIYDLADLVILDVKHINEAWHKKITGHSRANVLKNVSYRERSGKPMWLRYVLVPGWTDQEEYLAEWAKTFQNYKTIQRLEILPYHLLGVHKYKELGLSYPLEGVPAATKEQAEKVRTIFSRYFDNVVIG